MAKKAIVNLKQKEIAEYLRLLLDAMKALTDRVTKLEQKQALNLDLPPLPYAGSSTSLDPQRFEVIHVTSVDQYGTSFVGRRCQPIKDSPHWDEDPDLPTPVTVYLPPGVSVPTVGDYVSALFTGTYVDGDDDLGKYGYFYAEDGRPGRTTQFRAAYPTTADANIYEVDTVLGAFPQAAGTFGVGEASRGVVFACLWDQTPELLPIGTEVIVHKSNGQWWFTKPLVPGEIEFTLTSGFTTLAASAVVTASFDPNVVVGGTVTIHDDQSMWTDSITGCKGKAWRSHYTSLGVPYYRIRVLQRAVREAFATLSSNLCADTPAVTSWTAVPIGIHTVDPGAGTLVNSELHRAKSGDTVWFQRANNSPTFTWEVKSVTPHAQFVIFGLRVFSDVLQKFGSLCRLEYCEDPTWVDEITLVTASYVADLDGSACDLVATPGFALVFASTTGAPSTVLDFDQITVVTDVNVDSDSLNQVKRTVYVCSPGEEGATVVEDIEDCPPP